MENCFGKLYIDFPSTLEPLLGSVQANTRRGPMVRRKSKGISFKSLFLLPRAIGHILVHHQWPHGVAVNIPAFGAGDTSSNLVGAVFQFIYALMQRN